MNHRPRSPYTTGTSGRISRHFLDEARRPKARRRLAKYLETISGRPVSRKQGRS